MDAQRIDSALSVDFEGLRGLLAARLSPRTLAHSYRVAEHAARIAPRFGADPARALLAGLLHDYAKDLPREAYLAVAEREGITVFPSERDYPPLLHQRVGASQVRRTLGPKIPEDVVQAVRCHTTGRDDLDALGRCVLVADYTEPGRRFEGADALRAALARDPMEGFRAVLEFKRRWVARLGRQEHPWALRAYGRWLDSPAGAGR